MKCLDKHVLHFLPDAAGEELKLRSELLRYRDWASSQRASTCDEIANYLACLAHEAAGAIVFSADIPLHLLNHGNQLCRRLVGGALNAEHMRVSEVLRWTV